jgi:hypothetical protein
MSLTITIDFLLMGSCPTLWKPLLYPVLLSGQVIDIISLPILLTNFEFHLLYKFYCALFILPQFFLRIYIKLLGFTSVSLCKGPLWALNAHIGLKYNLWFAVLHFFAISLSHDILFL